MLSVTPRVSSSSPSRSTRSRDTSNHDFNRLLCCVCSKTDTENNLTAADTFHITKNKVDINRVLNLTLLGDSELSQLSSGDIVSNDFYDHKSAIKNCYVQFCIEYKQA